MTYPQDTAAATRHYFSSGDLTLSYLDFGGDGERVLLLLHGHMNDARVFTKFAGKIKGLGWRVLALDQRGHGWSGHSPEKDYSRASYVNDVLAFIRDVLGGQPVTLLGHSLGGLNAYQFAARYPQYVNAVIVEDIGAEIQADLSFVTQLPERSPSLQALRESLVRVGVRAVDYFSESVFEDERGWGFRSDLQGMLVSQQNCNGSWWEDWLASTCPILLIHGKKSFVMTESHAGQMVARRPNTQLAVFADCGHDVHTDDLEGYTQAVTGFLQEMGK
ncbi:alpha/beta fold hydrolase [Brevibacillus sp. GCM10020057]|uniref:alpha/beta fold hydrolase n=1 Tax=Brevibacillus sp. GCM10020057 TaxID=3317327 RepID=UPI00363DB1F8